MAIKRAIKAGNKSIISFKKVIKVGEITQWFDKDKFSPSQTDRTLTFTNNKDGSVTVSGVVVNTARAIYGISNLKELVKGHKYLLSGCPTTSIDDKFLSLNVYGADGALLAMYYDYGPGLIFTFDQEYYNRNVGGIYIYEREVGAEVNRTYIPQLFDLTEMFGAGHEPATVAEFKAKFPEAYYPYQRAVLTVYNKVVRPCARKGEVVQVADLSGFVSPYTRSGITFTNNGDGSITLNGTATADSYVILQPISKSIAGAVYLLGSEQNTLGYGVTNGLVLRADKWTYDPGVGATGAHTNYTLVVKNGVTVNNVIVFPQIYNLTAMYGAGNEPKTLADFRKDYPESYYPYNPIQTKNLFDIRKVSGLINAQFGNLDRHLTKNLTQNSLEIRYGGYGNFACLKEPIILPAGTYTFSCDCDYDVINSGHGVRLLVGKKAADGSRINNIVNTPYRKGHHLVLTFTLAEETEVYLSLQGEGGPDNYTNLNNVFFNIQLEKGSVATDYVPHDYI